jgi:hypothetical protein
MPTCSVGTRAQRTSPLSAIAAASCSRLLLSRTSSAVLAARDCCNAAQPATRGGRRCAAAISARSGSGNRRDRFRRGAVVPSPGHGLGRDLPLLSHGHLRASGDSLGMRGNRAPEAGYVSWSSRAAIGSARSRPIRSPQPVKTAIRPHLTAARVRGRYPARAFSPPLADCLSRGSPAGLSV